jgi:hypothetical protein
LVAKAIVQAVQQQDPPGRFIKLVNGDGITANSIWKSITYTQAVNKTSQALREKYVSNNNNNNNNNNRFINDDDTDTDIDIMNNIINDSKKKKQQQRQQQQQQQQQNNSSNKSTLDIVKNARDYMKNKGGRGEQTEESFHSLTNAAIQSADAPRKLSSKLSPISVLSSSSLGNYDFEGRGQGQKRKQADGGREGGSSMFFKPSWWNMGSPLLNDSSVSDSTSMGKAIMPPGIVTPGVASFVVNNNNNKSSDSSRSISNKRMRVQKEGGRSASGIITQRASASITDPLPLPTQPLEERQSTLFRFLNDTSIFSRGNSNTTTDHDNNNNNNNNIDPISLPENNISQNVSQRGHDDSSGSGSGSSGQQGQDDVFALNLQQSISGMFSFSRPGQQQQQQPASLLSFQGQGPMGRMTVEQLRELQVQKQQQQVQNFTGDRSGDAEEEEMQEILTIGLLTNNNSNNDSDIVASAAAPPTKGLASQASDWMASLFPATNSKLDGTPSRKFPPIHNGNNNDDEDEVAIPPPPGGGVGGVYGNPSLGRSVSSTIFGLVESPSLLLTSLKSGISSNFWDPFAPSPAAAVSSSSPMRRFPNNELQHFGGNVVNGYNIGGGLIGNPFLGQASERRESLLDDVEDTPMEKQLRENIVNGNTIGGGGLIRNPILGQARERRASLLDDFEDTPMEKQLRNAKREGTPRRESLLD